MFARLLRILALPLTTTLAIGALGVALVAAPLLMRRDSAPSLPAGFVRISDVGTPIDRGPLADPEPAPEPEPEPDTITIPRRWGHWSEGDEVVATFPAEDFDCACYRYARTSEGCVAGECWRTDEESARAIVFSRDRWRTRAGHLSDTRSGSVLAPDYQPSGQRILPVRDWTLEGSVRRAVMVHGVVDPSEARRLLGEQGSMTGASGSFADDWVTRGWLRRHGDAGARTDGGIDRVVGP